MEVKKNIRNLTLEELSTILKERGESGFRAKQIMEWIWKKGIVDFDQMTNLSIAFRNLLKDNFSLPHLTIAESQISIDRTIKNAFKLSDGNIVEGVLIPTTSRMTACISSQVGCSLTCKFCATGKLDRLRNLEAYEIYDQVKLIKEQSETKYQIPLSNIVMMGMGEPLLNYKNVLKGIEMITNPEGMGMSPQRITLSTAGIAKMIAKLGDDQVKFHLALSLHAANDEKRNKIMPINEQNSLSALKDALKHFYEKTGTRITLEYIVFKDFNDGLQDATELANFAYTVPSKVNLIEYNPIDDAEFKKTSPERLKAFVEKLEERKVIVNVRKSRGKDIDAACGQLVNKNKEALAERKFKKLI
jgi:23S rRNA (adenine2503-C2)-methyltransferase